VSDDVEYRSEIEIRNANVPPRPSPVYFAYRLLAAPPGDVTNGAAEPLRKAPAGRNQPCPCGSGKKFKKCCGRATG